MHKAIPLFALLAGAALGWGAARMFAPAPTVASPAPASWVARVDGEYISEQRFIDEMQQRGGRQPGQFQDLEQRRALLDALLYQKALVAAARRDGIDQLPEVRRTLDQVLANQVLQRQLRERQRAIEVPEQAVRAFYDANAAEYVVPARRRVAMIMIPVAEGADAAAWERAEAEAEAARKEASRLGADVRHFGPVAREYSHDQASRYRGGVIGWLSEGQRERYRHDAALLDAAFALEQPGQLSPVLRGADGVYLVRLVDLQPEQARPFEELAAGIRQRLLQQRVEAAETQFRTELLSTLEVEVDEEALARIDPLSPPADPNPPQPPALPSEG